MGFKEWFNSKPLWCKIVVPLLSLGLILMFIFIGVSIRYLDPLSYGLQYQSSSIKIDSETYYEPGRYFLGVGNSFIKFPRTTQGIIFSTQLMQEKASKGGAQQLSDDFVWLPTMSLRTKEGLPIQLDVYATYTLTTSTSNTTQQVIDVYEIYSRFEHNWSSFLQLVIEKSLRDIVSAYSTQDILAKRSLLTQSLTTSVRAAFKNYGFTLQNIELMAVNFQQQIKQVLQKQSIIDISNNQTAYQLQLAGLQGQTNVELATIDAAIEQTNAVTQAAQILTQNTAVTSAINVISNLQLNAVRGIQTNLAFTNCTTCTDKVSTTAARKTLAFLWIYIAQNSNANQSAVYTDRPTLLSF